MRSRNDFDPERFRFRGLHGDIYLGTASDRYAGWIGQIYSGERYEGRISKRTGKVGKKTFHQEVLPVESVKEYFEHFRVLELDYTFYRPLLEENGEPTQNYHTLKKYRDHISEGDFLILKVPQMIFARKIRRKGGYFENPDYLNPEIFVRLFYEPAVSLLGQTLRGFIFEQEYQRREERTPAKDLAEALDAFFDAVPEDNRYHIELRTESYLAGPVFDVFEKYGIGQVLSHWTWLPPLGRQFAKADRRFFNSGKQGIIRLMTPRGVRYEDAYMMAYPFDKLVESMLQPGMIEETVDITRAGIEQGTSMNVIINNRSGGNAPFIAQQIAMQFTEAT